MRGSPKSGALLLTRPEPAYDSFRIPALDGLRGLAVAGVLLFHTGHLRGGFLGVDLFFVLSGFLITGLLLREVGERGGVGLAGFWGRRLRRLFPALAVVLVVVTLGVWGLQRLGADIDRSVVRTALADAPWVQLDLVNWHLLAQDAGYWEAFGQVRVFQHLWSIAVEEQFYLVWPVVVGLVAWGVRRVGRRRCVGGVGGVGGAGGVAEVVLVVSVVGSLVSLALMVALVDPADTTRVYTGTDTRAFSLLLGAAAATAPVRRGVGWCVGRAGRSAGWGVGSGARWGAGWVVGALLVGLGAAWGLVDGTESQGLFTGGLYLHALACALLVVLCAEMTAAGSAGRSRTPRVLEHRWLRYLGGISYGLYLWHWPVVALVPDELGVPQWCRSVLVIGLSVALAVCSKHLLEDPIRFRARWARGRTGLVVFLLVSAALLALWSVLPGPVAPRIDLEGL